MPLTGTIQQASDGSKGFDANTPVSAATAQAFVEHGYRFCIRYVGRVQMASYDLTAGEAETILSAGLALMTVQHVLNPGWSPTGALGTQYGTNAAAFTRQIGFPQGVNVWCDLECVADGASAQDVIDYCNGWYDQVAAAGYVPGLYVGYQPGLTNDQLYSALKFQHYWGAYNVDAVVPHRGWQLKQSVGSGTIGGLTTEVYDDDHAMADQQGGRALWLAGA